MRSIESVRRVSDKSGSPKFAAATVAKGLFGQLAPSSEHAVAISMRAAADGLARPPPQRSRYLCQTDASRPRSAHAALDVQRTCPARRPERGLPDEHVHRCPADRVDRRGGAAGSSSSTATRPAGRARSATPSARSPSTASSSRAATPIATTCAQFFHEVRESREQLRMTVLTTLQCNFACDYCIQGDHGDYNKHAAKMSLETAARVGDWAEQRLDDAAPGELRADVLRRRAAAEPAGDVLPRRAACGRSARRAASACSINIITNGLLLTPGDRRSAERLRPERHQDHARRRSRHAQPDAAAARRPGHLRQDRPQRPAGRAQDADRHRRQLRRWRPPTAIRRCSTSCKEQDFADKLSKVAFKPIIRERKEQPAPAGAAGQGLEVHRADRGRATSRWAARA